MPVATKTVFLNADGEPVAEDDAGAATLLVREGTYISEGDAKRYNVATEPESLYDAVADHEAKHGGETEAQARAARTRMLEGQPDPDGPAVEGERGDVTAATSDEPATDEKATDAPPDTKAVTKAPANKGR